MKAVIELWPGPISWLALKILFFIKPFSALLITKNIINAISAKADGKHGLLTTQPGANKSDSWVLLFLADIAGKERLVAPWVTNDQNVLSSIGPEVLESSSTVKGETG